MAINAGMAIRRIVRQWIARRPALSPRSLEEPLRGRLEVRLRRRSTTMFATRRKLVGGAARLKSRRGSPHADV
jgi:hypothetical protein